MSGAGENNNLETARARLESALSSLAQGVALSKDALNVAAQAGGQKTALEARVHALEAENLKLHEQIAAHALQSENNGQNSERLAAVEAEKATLQANYQLLKEKYAALQDEMEKAASAVDSDAGAAFSENTRLKQVIEQMEAEKTAIRGELDKTISELELLVEGD